MLALDALWLCRPTQWLKNIFVVAPLLFSETALQPSALIAVATALSCFCLWSSSIYCINDIWDVKTDQAHPRKRERPIASGRIRPAMAISLAVALIGAATVLALLMLPPAFVGIGYVYLASSLAYITYLKQRVIIDVLSIAIGYVLRLLAGCLAIDVQPTSWILVCGFSLALILGFGKRRLELASLERASEYRPNLQSYSSDKLNILLGTTSAMCLLSYMLYTVSPETIKLHRTDALIYSVPFVTYGIFRFLFKVQEGQYDGPVELLLRDPVFSINGALWLITVIAILYCGNRSQ
jgi:4-hydroxybenzoate polyprenyltransferase